jgi:HlyD family secretion protein
MELIRSGYEMDKSSSKGHAMDVKNIIKSWFFRFYPKNIIFAALALVVLSPVYLKYSSSPRQSLFSGYVISDNVYMASPVAGTVMSVNVKRGQRVQIGTPLFQMDLTSQVSQAEKTKALIEEAEFEKEVRQAELVAAEAANKFAIADMNRFTSIQAKIEGAVSQQDIDTVVEAEAKSRANVVSAKNQISAANSRIESSRAELRDIEHRIGELSPKSPVSGRIEEVMYKPGEWAAANSSIISIVPDNEIKIRFYIPQNQLSKFQIGTKVAVSYDGGPKNITATIDFISTRPEYTPPVIYSLSTRDKLVFMAEAAPDNPTQLIPGQPMDVWLMPDKSR